MVGGHRVVAVDGLADQVRRGLVAARLMGKNSQKMKAVRIVWIRRQKLSVASLGLRQGGRPGGGPVLAPEIGDRQGRLLRGLSRHAGLTVTWQDSSHGEWREAAPGVSRPWREPLRSTSVARRLSFSSRVRLPSHGGRLRGRQGPGRRVPPDGGRGEGPIGTGRRRRKPRTSNAGLRRRDGRCRCASWERTTRWEWLVPVRPLCSGPAPLMTIYGRSDSLATGFASSELILADVRTASTEFLDQCLFEAANRGDIAIGLWRGRPYWPSRRAGVRAGRRLSAAMRTAMAT